MGKKFFALLICIVFIFSSCLILSSCNKEQLKIVYLGDSIAEAILGPSPLSERENYGYYSLIGRRNNYLYYNRAVSGHQSKQLVDILKEEDSGATMTQTHLKQADIIHISILGNDLLQNSLGELILAVAKEDFSAIDAILAQSKNNFAEIVSILKSYNKNAVIFFQNVYNPVCSDCTIIENSVRTELSALGYEESEYRDLGKIMLNRLNSVISDYLSAHHGEFYIIDAFSEFDRIYKEDAERGKSLIFEDWVHPSNEGHAVLADLTQAKLEELGLAKRRTALKAYREIRTEQLNRMFSSSLDVNAVSKKINKANTCKEITKIYFEAIKGKTPVYC